MKKTLSKSETAAPLRKKAEAMLRQQSERLDKLSGQEIKHLIEELGTHQIELEMQNEELRRTHQELEVSRRRYADLYDFAPVGYFTFDEKGLILEVNLTGAQMLGLNKRSLIGKPFSPFIDKGDRTVFRSHCSGVIKKGVLQECEIRLIGKRGKPLHVQLRSISAGDEDDPPACCRTAVIDITESKRAASALEEAYEKLRTTLESIADGFFSFDHEWRYTYVNETALRLLRRTREELIGRVVWDVFPEARHLLFYTEGHRALSQNLPVHFEEFYPDPLNAWYECHCFPSRDGLSVYFRDITERKKTEEALRQNEEKLRFHMENSPMAIVEWDSGFVVTRWAGEAERLFGWSAGEMVGRRITDLKMIYEEDIPIVQKVMERLTDGVSRKVVSSNRNYTKDGRVIHCTWYNSALTDQEGRMASVMSLILDITDRKKAEEQILRQLEELRESNEELSRLNRAMVDRELRMIELKKEINELCAQAGEPPRYPLDFEKEKK